MENLEDILKRLATRGISDGPGTRSISDQPGTGSISEGSPGGYLGGAEQEGEPCPRCNGRGLLTLDVPVGDPAFGQVVTCDCRESEIELEQTERLLRYSNLGHLARFAFDTLASDGLSGDPDSQAMFRGAARAAEEYAESPSGWLVFTGPHGSGKTHLAAAIATRRILQGQVVFFADVPDLLDHLRSTFGPTSELSYSDLFEQVRNTPLLVLDGLGSHSSTAWAEEKLRQIVNRRFNAELPTVVTVSGSLDDVDPYILSRLRAPGFSRVLQVRQWAPEASVKEGRIEPHQLEEMTFERFDVSGNNATDTQQSSLQTASRSAKAFADNPKGWLILIGRTGAGKTHLAVAIAVEQIAAGSPPMFWIVPELMDYLRYTFNPESPVAYDRVLEEVKSAPLLILDDLGRERGSSWAVETLYQIVVHRHNARLPTVITTGMVFKDELDPITSRIQDRNISELVRVDAPDYRGKMDFVVPSQEPPGAHRGE